MYVQQSAEINLEMFQIFRPRYYEADIQRTAYLTIKL